MEIIFYEEYYSAADGKDSVGHLRDVLSFHKIDSLE